MGMMIPDIRKCADVCTCHHSQDGNAARVVVVRPINTQYDGGIAQKETVPRIKKPTEVGKNGDSVYPPLCSGSR